MFDAIQLLDFGWQQLIHEAFLIGHHSNGGYAFECVKELPMDLYEQVYKIAKDMNNAS
ncbi:MAG: hypothetical protein GF388_05990 [Candidatus Aegiribacteria sp.]|nr:hypothetical protein [Candidatus Aegiribacteria sp.]